MHRYLLISVAALLSGCTLSFQNIDTHGTATDLVDDTQANTPAITTSITPPII